MVLVGFHQLVVTDSRRPVGSASSAGKLLRCSLGLLPCPGREHGPEADHHGPVLGLLGSYQGPGHAELRSVTGPCRWGHVRWQAVSTLGFAMETWLSLSISISFNYSIPMTLKVTPEADR